jgi:septin family protein
MLVDYIRIQQDQFAARERDVSLPRAKCVDGRVDVVLYFLPLNARVAGHDVEAMRTLTRLVPVVPIMCKVLSASLQPVLSSLVMATSCHALASDHLLAACTCLRASTSFIGRHLICSKEQADCLEEGEVHERKDEMARLINEGLDVFKFPDDLMKTSYEAAYGLSATLDDDTSKQPQPMPFRLPFNIVAGNDADRTVHPYWFVRKYRCDALRTKTVYLRMR